MTYMEVVQIPMHAERIWASEVNKTHSHLPPSSIV